MFEPETIARHHGCVYEYSGGDYSVCAVPESASEVWHVTAASASPAFVKPGFGSPMCTEAVVASPAYVTVVFGTPVFVTIPGASSVIVTATFVYSVCKCSVGET